MNKLVEYIDVAVIGAGHAGCEASRQQPDWGLKLWYLPSVWTASR